MVTHAERKQFTLDEYHRLAEAGILTEDDNVELINGQIVQTAAMGKRHAGCVAYLDELLHTAAPSQAMVRVQLPVAIPKYDEPEPDVVMIRRRDDYYRGGHPIPDDVLLLIEVANTSLAFERDIKFPIYAKALIPEAWLIDLTGEVIERHTDPSPGGYRLVTRAWRGESIESLALPGLALRADEVLG